MKKTRNALTLALSAAFIATVFSGCGKAASTAAKTPTENDLRTIRVANMTGQPDQYADLIGTEQGIFEKYKIKLETTEFVAGINTVDAIVNGTADIGLLADFAAVNRFGNTLEDNTLVIASDLSSSKGKNYSGGLYVAPEYADDPKTLDSSKGWVTNIGTVSEYYNWQAQTYLGLDPAGQKSVQVDSVSTQLAVVHNKEASEAVVTGSLEQKYIDEGWKKIADPAEMGIDISTYLITTREYAEKNTDLLADYIKALDESTAYISEDLDASAEKISERYGIDEEDFKSNWKQYDITFGLSEEAARHLDEVNRWAYENKKFPKEYDIRDFYYTAAAKKAFPDNVTVKLKGDE